MRLLDWQSKGQAPHSCVQHHDVLLALGFSSCRMKAYHVVAAGGVVSVRLLTSSCHSSLVADDVYHCGFYRSSLYADDFLQFSLCIVDVLV